MYEAPSNKIILKRIGITLSVVIGTIAIAWGVILLLKAAAPQPPADEPASSHIFKPAEVIEAFAKEGAINALDAQNFALQTSKDSASVIYKPASSNFAVVTLASNQALFYSKTPQAADVSQEVGEQTAALLQTWGYQKIENVGSARTENPTYTTFETSLSICQLSSSKPIAGSAIPLYHKLACLDKAAVQAEYDTLTPLLTLFKESGQAAPAYDEVSRTTKTDGNKSLAILNLAGNSNTTSLLFAAVNNKWTYLGNLSNNEAGSSNGKYILSAELRRAIADPMYGDFLTKNLQ